MKTVKLKPLFHHDEEIIGIYAPPDAGLNYVLQKNAGARWSKTKKCWYIPCKRENYEQLACSLKGIVNLEADELKQYLVNRRKKTAEARLPVAVMPSKSEQLVRDIRPQTAPIRIISDENKQQLQKFLEQLQLKAYSQSTIRTYRNEFLPRWIKKL